MSKVVLESSTICHVHMYIHLYS